jgi:hypothetical protein
MAKEMKLALALLLATVTAAAAQQKQNCYSSPDPQVGGPPWAWRMIDGRTCWYPGERKRAKHLLHWVWEEPIATKESATPTSPAAETELSTPISAPEQPEPLQSYSPEDQILLESYWPDLRTLLAERSPTYTEMFNQSPPQAATRWRDADVVSLLLIALAVVSGLAVGLEMLLIRHHGRKTA